MSPSPNLELRPAGPADYEHIVWAVGAAASWNPERAKLPDDVPELARYHRGWGRRGDRGVIADLKGRFVGVAFCRLLDEDEPGYGFVDPATPELGVAVVEQFRGRGIGTILMHELAGAARRAGAMGLSLSVHAANPARGWYRRLGYREVSVDGTAVRMVKDFSPSW